MIKWFINNESPVPLYVQLKELIRYYISTGAIQSNQRLPTIKDLSRKLEVNFETIRKAYKDLEQEGLLTTKRGSGTFASNHASSGASTFTGTEIESTTLSTPKAPLKRLLREGVLIEEIKIMVAQALSEVSAEASEQSVIFTECNVSQILEISSLLQNYLGLNVAPVLLGDLRKETERLARSGSLLAVLTTGFHMNEVRKALQGLAVKVDFLVTSMSPETRRQLASVDKTNRYGFICRDVESIPFYREMLREELGLHSNIECCILDDESRVKELMETVGVLLVSPPVYDDVKKLAPSNLLVFNVFNRVDPMSLMIIKENILGATRPAWS